mgnify:FL=1
MSHGPTGNENEVGDPNMGRTDPSDWPAADQKSQFGQHYPNYVPHVINYFSGSGAHKLDTAEKRPLVRQAACSHGLYLNEAESNYVPASLAEAPFLGLLFFLSSVFAFVKLLVSLSPFKIHSYTLN